jgi:DNA-binding NarL/FixJ family response regulator
MTRKTIVCVDEESIILEGLNEQRQKLFASKYFYETADNVKDAFELLEDLAEDGCDVLLIVSDWILPDMSAERFIGKVHEEFPCFNTVLLTDQTDQKMIDTLCKKVNVQGVIYKPWTEDDLKKIINHSFNGGASKETKT